MNCLLQAFLTSLDTRGPYPPRVQRAEETNLLCAWSWENATPLGDEITSFNMTTRWQRFPGMLMGLLFLGG